MNELANDVKEIIGEDIKIITCPSDDNRSYHVSSKKIQDVLGFKPLKTVKDAVIDLQNAFKNKFLQNTLENEFYFNIKRMKNINLK